jgi:hypothetical protein
MVSSAVQQVLDDFYGRKKSSLAENSSLAHSAE